MRPPPPLHAIVVAASTGGPAAVATFLAALPVRDDTLVLVAQHMHPEVLEGFAARLRRTVGPHVRVGRPGEALTGGTVIVLPAWGDAVVTPRADGGLVLAVEPGRRPSPPRHRPDADRILAALAPRFGPRLTAVVLSGMGTDGLAGARAVRGHGGKVYAQDPARAAAPGMPGSVVAVGLAAATGDPGVLAHAVALDLAGRTGGSTPPARAAC